MMDTVVGFGFGFMAGALLALDLLEAFWKKEAIKRGFAELDPKTGEWKWKEPEQRTSS